MNILSFFKRPPKKYVTFFGGAMNNTDTKEYRESISIGTFLASKNYIVKNGGYIGLMEAVSKGASQAGGIVYGYTCKTFGFVQGNDFLTKNIVCKNIYNRLQKLIKGSNIYIVQNGGIGTLSEVFLLLDETRKVEVKPTIYIFGDAFKDLFFDFLHKKYKILRAKQLSNIVFCKDYFDFISKFKD